jgi:hypothetical protein
MKCDSLNQCLLPVPLLEHVINELTPKENLNAVKEIQDNYRYRFEADKQ